MGEKVFRINKVSRYAVLLSPITWLILLPFELLLAKDIMNRDGINLAKEIYIQVLLIFFITFATFTIIMIILYKNITKIGIIMDKENITYKKRKKEIQIAYENISQIEIIRKKAKILFICIRDIKGSIILIGNIEGKNKILEYLKEKVVPECLKEIE
jgi:hypothetical protein